MPTYEYACSACTEQFELRLSMDRHTEPETQPCPACGKENTVKQQFSMFAMGDPIRLGVKRPDGGFTEVMDRIKKNHPQSAMAQRNQGKYGRTGVV